MATKLEKGDEVFDVWFDSSFAWSTLLSEDKNLKELKDKMNHEITIRNPNLQLSAPESLEIGG